MNLFKYVFESILVTKPENKSGISFDLGTIHRGHHNTLYKGVRCQKCPFDYVMYQMILWEIKPDLIIEIGTLSGGGALYLADLLDLNGKGTIHTIDIENQSDPKVKKHPRIKLFYKGWEAYDIKMAKHFKKIMVVDDGSHTYEQVRDALTKFSPLVSKGSYYIVEDGVLTELNTPIKYHGGPTKALKEFVKKNKKFSIDRKWTDMFGHNATFNVDGYLKRL
jgi:cephalosporin hydroxylase